MPRRKAKKHVRTRGTGSVSRRATGYYAQLPRALDPKRGGQMFHATGRSREAWEQAKADAHDWLDAALDRHRRGWAARPGDESLIAFLRRWSKMQPWPLSTRLTYEGCIAHTDPIGRTTLSRLRVDALQEWLAGLLAAGLSARYVRQIRSLVGSALKQAVRWELIPTNPMEATTMPKNAPVRIRYWTADEARRFLEAASGTRFDLFWQVALAVGLRNGELRGLKWEDLDLDTGALWIRRGMSRVGPRSEQPTKSRRDRRVMLPPTVLARVRAYRASLDRISPYIFARPDGQPWSRSVFDRELARLIGAAGVRPLSNHGLRHTYASIALRNDTDVNKVAQVLGHHSAGFTYDRYGHVLQKDEEAAGIMDRALFGGKEKKEDEAGRA